MSQESRWATVVYLERVELAANIKKETNGRVKMGKSQDGLLLFTPPPPPPQRVKLTVNKQQERNKWQGQNGPRVKMGYSG